MPVIFLDIADASAPPLRGNVVVYSTNLADRSAEADLALLDDAERARAARYRFEQDRARFISGRAFLRCVLAELTARHPGAVRFKYNRYGKPCLEGSESDGPAFSFSRTGELAVVAVAEGRPVGVDVEDLSGRVPRELDMMARSILSPNEYAAYAAVVPRRRWQVFLDYWTAKEAVLKAIGVGLAVLPLQDVEICRRRGFARPMLCQRWLLGRSRIAQSTVAVAVLGGNRI